MKIKQKKGISLIVLVITIIVMIILATAIILSLNSSGIIGKANKATTESNMANKKEAASVALAEYELAKQLGELSAGETATSYVQKALEDQGIEAEDVVVDAEGNIVVGPAAILINNNVEIGAMVTGYALTEGANYTTSGMEHNGEDENGTEYVGEAQNVILNADITWKYIGMDESGNIMIAADATDNLPVIELAFQGGHVYGAEELNKACSALYSTSKGKARNMNIGDVIKLLEYTGPKGMYINLDEEYEMTNTALSIETIENIITERDLSWSCSPNGSSIYSYLSDYYHISKTSNYITSSETIQNLIYQNTAYWLASECAFVDFPNGMIEYKMRYVGNNKVDGATIYYSAGYLDGLTENYTHSYTIRPVVTLNSNVILSVENGNIVIN